VYPFPEQSRRVYEVEITDGGPGDVDDAVDGSCLFRTRVCLGSSSAAPETCGASRIRSFSASLAGRLDRSVRDATVENLVEGVSRLFDGPESPGHKVSFATAPFAKDGCVDVPVRVPTEASQSRRRSVRLNLAVGVPTAEDATVHYGSRLRLRCDSRPPSGRVQTLCRAHGRDCAAVAPTTNATSPSPGRVFYLSPSGNDTSPGTSVSSPWRTFGRVLNSKKLLQPGDTLVLLDGTYTRTTTGLPRIDCGTSGTASNGQSGRPITIRALNERRAYLKSDGFAAAFDMLGCSWWIVEGLRASNADNSSGTLAQGFPFHFAQVNNVTGRRLLGSHNNRKYNTHVFGVDVSQNVLLEECEAYYFHRHGFSIWRSRYVDLRRCYANSMLYGAKGCCGGPDERNYGDEAVSLYGTSDSIVENCISENRANGYQIHGISSPLDPSGHGGRNNRILGSISRDDAVASLVSSRSSSGDYHNASGNLFRDFLAAYPVGHGIVFRAAAANRAENVTLYGSTYTGLTADGSGGDLGGTCSKTLVCPTTGKSCSSSSDCPNKICTRNPQGCSFGARNLLALNNRGYGVQSVKQQDWLVEYSNAIGNDPNYITSEPIGDGAGNIRYSMSAVPTGMGMGAGQCIAWPPTSSNMAKAGMSGGPVGASILFRYENGSLTTKPLWNPSTRAFPCGAVVPGLNDGTMRCSNVHTRLGIAGGGCQLPAGYGG